MMENEIISRKDAKARGLKRYFTGNPCKHGHVAERRLKEGVCGGCKAQADKKYRKENLEKARAYRKKWDEKNPHIRKQSRKRSLNKMLEKMGISESEYSALKKQRRVEYALSVEGVRAAKKEDEKIRKQNQTASKKWREKIKSDPERRSLFLERKRGQEAARRKRLKERNHDE